MWRRRKQREADVERELRLHLDLEAEECRQNGLAEGEARFAARRALGNATLLKEDIRSMWTWASLDRLAKDVRYGLRTIRANPTFSAAAVLSLALGIGANTAIFSLVDALLLRSLPVRNPGELVQLYMVQRGSRVDSFGYPTLRALAERRDLFLGVAGFSAATFNVASGDANERVAGAWVTGDFYPTLGLEPFAGRLLTPLDDRPGAPPAAVVSYSYWVSHYGRDFGVVGRTISVEGQPVTIVGISPPGFDGANVGTAANLTLAFAVVPQIYPERSAQLESGPEWIRALARPQPEISMAQAKARLNTIWPRIAPITTTPRMRSERRQALLSSSMDLGPGGTGFSYFREKFEQPLMILMAVTGLVLLIACANFANLLLARGAARSKEIAMRFAIGAGRARIIRQLLTESLMLSTMGTMLGVGLAAIGSQLLVALMPGSGTMVLDLRPDVRVLLFTTAIALATGIVFGLVPAMRATALGPAAVLKADSGITPRSRSRLLPALVVSQVALSVVLLFGAGLFVRTLQNLERIDPGFRSEGVILVNLDARRAGYKDARLAALYGEIAGRFAAIRGVRSASVSDNTPLSGGYWTDGVSINGAPLSNR